MGEVKAEFYNSLEQNSKWKQEYAIELNNRFEILENMEDDNIDNNINKKWENKTVIKETKQQLIEKNEITETVKNRWYDEECKISMEEMKRARAKWLIKKEEGRMKSRSITIKEKKHTKELGIRKSYTLIESIEEE